MKSNRRKFEGLVSLCTQRVHLVFHKLSNGVQLARSRRANCAQIHPWLRAHEWQRSKQSYLDDVHAPWLVATAALGLGRVELLSAAERSDSSPIHR